MRITRFKSSRLRNRSGMALMLVIPAVAVAAVLAYAVLANTGTQEQISANSELLAQTDCLASTTRCTICSIQPTRQPMQATIGLVLVVVGSAWVIRPELLKFSFKTRERENILLPRSQTQPRLLKSHGR